MKAALCSCPGRKAPTGRIAMPGKSRCITATGTHTTTLPLRRMSLPG
jgi:hypothetical protein